MGNKITELVLGGEGLIGAELKKQLEAREHDVISLDLKSGCDLRYVEDSFYSQCDRVWFLAWDTGGAKYHSAAEKQHQMYKHNCELSARVFEALARTQRPFIFITSQLAGQPTAYGLTKLMGEKWAEQLGGKIARLWNTYGWEEPDIRSHVVTDLVVSGLKNGIVKTHTTAMERRKFIYKSDCVAALIRLFDSSIDYGEIAGDRWISIQHLAEEIGRQLNTPVELGSIIGEEVIVDPVCLVPHFSPTVTLEDGLAKVIIEARNWLGHKPAYAAAKSN
jgi:nucleoside-diphosphate-sugar epimerase